MKDLILRWQEMMTIVYNIVSALKVWLVGPRGYVHREKQMIYVIYQRITWCVYEHEQSDS